MVFGAVDTVDIGLHRRTDDLYDLFPLDDLGLSGQIDIFPDLVMI